MFVLADCIAWLGHLVALFILYKETESVILIYTKSFSQNSECSFSLSLSACLHVLACFLPLLNFLRACILDFNNNQPTLLRFFFFFKEKIKCVSLMVHHIAQHSKARQDEHFKFCFNFLFTFPFVIIWKSENGWYFSPLINLELKRYNKIQIAQIAYVVHHLWLIWSNENDIIYFIIIDNNHRPARCVEKIKTYKH